MSSSVQSTPVMSYPGYSPPSTPNSNMYSSSSASLQLSPPPSMQNKNNNVPPTARKNYNNDVTFMHGDPIVNSFYASARPVLVRNNKKNKARVRLNFTNMKGGMMAANENEHTPRMNFQNENINPHLAAAPIPQINNTISSISSIGDIQPLEEQWSQSNNNSVVSNSQNLRALTPISISSVASSVASSQQGGKKRRTRRRNKNRRTRRRNKNNRS